jgi:hypothetical protein
MNSKQTAAGKTAQKTYSVRCDAFDLQHVNAMQIAQGSTFVGWQYANQEKTEVEVVYQQPLLHNPISFNVHNLIDDLLSLFLRGVYTREEADRILTVIEGRCA